ncbi:hypothetical protein Hanom_Chr11g01042031 [Helianthus anomalus]
MGPDLDKIIGGTILYNFKIFGWKIEKFTLLTETLGGGSRVHPSLHTKLRPWSPDPQRRHEW